jgi:hypothetical protein
MVIWSSVFTMRVSPTVEAVTTPFIDLTHLDALICSAAFGDAAAVKRTVQQPVLLLRYCRRHELLTDADRFEPSVPNNVTSGRATAQRHGRAFRHGSSHRRD